MVKFLLLTPRERRHGQCPDYHVSADGAKSICCQRHSMLPLPTSNASCIGYSQHAAASGCLATTCKYIALFRTQLYVIFCTFCLRIPKSNGNFRQKYGSLFLCYICVMQCEFHTWHKDAVRVVTERSAGGAWFQLHCSKLWHVIYVYGRTNPTELCPKYAVIICLNVSDVQKPLKHVLHQLLLIEGEGVKSLYCCW